MISNITHIIYKIMAEKQPGVSNALLCYRGIPPPPLKLKTGGNIKFGGFKATIKLNF